MRFFARVEAYRGGAVHGERELTVGRDGSTMSELRVRIGVIRLPRTHPSFCLTPFLVGLGGRNRDMPSSFCLSFFPTAGVAGADAGGAGCKDSGQLPEAGADGKAVRGPGGQEQEVVRRRGRALRFGLLPEPEKLGRLDSSTLSHGLCRI